MPCQSSISHPRVMSSSLYFVLAILIFSGLCEARWVPTGQQQLANPQEDLVALVAEAHPRARYRLHSRGEFMQDNGNFQEYLVSN